MSKTKITAACIVYACGLNLPVLCQPSNKTPQSVARPSTAQRKQLPLPLQVSVDGPSIGPKFTGHDIKGEVAAVKRSPASQPKSEFESTDQYQARVAAYKGPEKMAFRLFNEVDGEANVEANYDADSQVLTIDIKPLTYSIDGHDASVDGFLLKRDSLGTQKYVGSNAFGVKKMITRQDYAEYGALLSADDPVFVKDAFESFGHPIARFRIQMKPMEAAIIKTALRAVLVCTVADPKVFHDTTSDEPTISHPYETNTLRQFMPVTTRELILYNDITGQVVARRSPDSWRTESPSKFDLNPRPFSIKVALSGRTKVSVDGGEEKFTDYGSRGTIYARERVNISVSMEYEMKGINCLVNNKPFEPNWKVNRTSYGSFQSASFEIVALDGPGQ